MLYLKFYFTWSLDKHQLFFSKAIYCFTVELTDKKHTHLPWMQKKCVKAKYKLWFKNTFVNNIIIQNKSRRLMSIQLLANNMHLQD